MDTNILFYCIVLILLIQYLIETVLEVLNHKSFLQKVPPELADVFDQEEYRKAKNYQNANYSFGFLQKAFSFFSTLIFLLIGGFNWLDQTLRIYTDNPYVLALLFFGILFFVGNLAAIPFAYYQTFKIESKFGFNKTTITTFVTDIFKGWGLTIVFGSALLSILIWFLQWAGVQFWLYVWGVFIVFMLVINLFYSKLIVPLFNKQEPLGSGTLKLKIENYAQKVGFQLQNIFVIDGSKRSTKANAYFSGFGKQKRVTLFDTLLNDLEQEEIVAVLAHEVGHYKKRHIVVNLLASVLTTGFTLFVLSLFINNPDLSKAIKVQIPSYHAALLAFGLLYSPISTLTGLVMNYLSRKFEFQADNYAKETYAAQPLISSLKKLSKNNLSNLSPHPAYVFMYYSHPPLVERIRNLKA
ncbi:MULTISPECIES: M48 family metallopeptidase [Flavobacteriaceae]|uniref:M48 family metallopeptidase n=1 Tax=Flavobacteriaceae TaxID=49546 RepID=UPI0010AE2EA4|nr:MULTISPECIES: M48 family metallopeptidase [Flavobacteriaceae]NJB37626.1 M48 family metallopeptidase [Croceivirga sp. JEA036]TKD62454.1 M48 family metallopeptidase [Flavobacterium sp. ASW18X]